MKRARIGSDYVEVEYQDLGPGLTPEEQLPPPPPAVVKPSAHPTEGITPGYAALFGDSPPRFSKPQG